MAAGFYDMRSRAVTTRAPGSSCRTIRSGLLGGGVEPESIRRQRAGRPESIRLGSGTGLVLLCGAYGSITRHRLWHPQYFFDNGTNIGYGMNGLFSIPRTRSELSAVGT